ncbi:MAG: phosphoribosyltransferase, partial [Mycobacteriales bacterium]
ELAQTPDLGDLGGEVLVLGLPRGGVPVALEVAQALGAELDVILVRKLGVPGRQELAMGAIGEGGVLVKDQEVLRAAQVTTEALAAVQRREQAELDRQAQRWRAGRPALGLAGRTVVIVDDGIATGSTARAACEVVRAAGALRILLATPVAAKETLDRLGAAGQVLVCLSAPHPFRAVGHWYADFAPVSDAAVSRLLAEAHRPG